MAISWYKTPEVRIVCTVNAILLRQGSKKAASFDFPVPIINESRRSYMKLRRIEQLCVEEKSQSSTSPTKNYMSTQLNHQLQVGVWMILGTPWSFLDRALRIRMNRRPMSRIFYRELWVQHFQTHTYSWWITNTDLFMVFAMKTMVGSWNKSIALVRSIWICFFLLSEGAGVTTAGWDMNMFLPHEMCKICKQHVQNPGIITWREGDYIYIFHSRKMG